MLEGIGYFMASILRPKKHDYSDPRLNLYHSMEKTFAN